MSKWEPIGILLFKTEPPFADYMSKATPIFVKNTNLQGSKTLFVTQQTA